MTRILIVGHEPDITSFGIEQFLQAKKSEKLKKG